MRVTHTPADGSLTSSKLIARGAKRHGYHRDVFNAAQLEVRAFFAAWEPQREGDGGCSSMGTEFRIECVGGGRMQHDAEQGSLHVFGYSSEYGAAPHELTVALL